ncbi:YjbQ family protein [[Eubacterium] cellulosolvens]
MNLKYDIQLFLVGEPLIVRTSKKKELADVTWRIRQHIYRSSIRDGLCIIFIPHIPANITIKENADPRIQEDISLI